ncbi:MAG: hypothetical protein PHY48_12825 [Candidatus Cloacimonetes bacterium]|nr:hypothetical protein [Candidatus Cloacimonadota bacterium]
MNCPKCKCQTKVLKTHRLQSSTFRIRKCPNCGRTYYTSEYFIDPEKVQNAANKSS